MKYTEFVALDPKARYLLAALDRIEALGMQLADQRDELRARFAEAAPVLRRAVDVATAALDEANINSSVHDHLVDVLFWLREVEMLLIPELQEAPSQQHIRRH